MAEAFVQLLCPGCGKTWESTPRELPDPSVPFECPTCGERRRTAEFMRTDRDLATLKRLS